MTGIVLKGFSGERPALDPRVLPENAATYALDLRMGSGVLEPIRELKLVKALSAATKFAFRLPTTAVYTPDLSQGYWWEFTDENTDVVRGPTVNDSFERYYYCSPSTGFRFNTKANIIAGTGIASSHAIGVPRPTSAPGLNVTAGSGSNVTRSYVVTFVNDYGEESGPSPAVEGTGPSGGSWNLTALPGYVPSGVDYALPTKMNIYRTVTAYSGSTVFNFVAQVPIGTGAYNDTISDIVVGGQTELETSETDPPPAGLEGMALMPNGIMVAFKDNNLYFSDNFKP